MHRTWLIIGLVVGLAAGCGPSAGAEASDVAPQGDATDAVGGDTFAPGAALRWTLDPSRVATAMLEPYGATLSLTDGAGATWTLEIPRQIGLLPVPLTMTAIVDVQPGEGAPPIVRGVVFEPDGLMLSKPATLTVSLPPGTGDTAFYHFAGDGTGPRVDPAERTGDSVTIAVDHFSGEGLAPDPGFARMCAEAEADFKDAQAEAKALKATPVTVEDPPEVDMHCLGQANKGGLGQDLPSLYAEQVSQPEAGVVQRLLAASRILNTVCGHDSTVAGDTAGVRARLSDKAAALVKLPYNADWSAPITVAVLRIDRALTLLNPADDYAARLASLSTRSWKARDEYLRRLREEHDYQLFRAILHADKAACMLDSNNCNLAGTLERVAKAARFEVEIQVHLSVNQPSRLDANGEDCIPGLVGAVALGGKGTFAPGEDVDGFEPRTFRFTYSQGSLDVPYLDAPGCGYTAHSELVGEPAYTSVFDFAMNACDDEANEIIVYSLGADDTTEHAEVWHTDLHYPQAPADDFSEDGPETNAAFFAAAAFEPYTLAQDGYRFQPLVTNRSATPIDKEFTGSTQEPYPVDGRLQLTVTHKPQ